MNYGRYEIFRELGKGSMGDVYLAHDPQIDRPVALKVLRPDRIASEDFVQRFLQEARAIGRLSHPNIVTVFDSGQDQNTLFIVMEFLTGKTLIEKHREQPFSYQTIIHLGVQLAEALGYAHRQGIVHRDIKPSNILVTEEGRIKITDFGIARVTDSAAHQQTQAGDILGTPMYMSPEQVLGRKVDGRSDLYSLGVILYELTTGQNPFRSEGLAAVFNAIIEHNPPAPNLTGSPEAQRLAELITKSISKAPEDRFQTGEEMAQAFKACLQRRRSDTPQPSAPSRPPSRGIRFGLPLALLALAGGGAAYYMVSHSLPPPLSVPSPSADIQAPSAPPAVLKQGTFEVKSEPAGADIFVDGAFKGQTPLKIELPLGTYEMKLTSPHHFDWEGQLLLEQEGTVPLTVRMVPMQEATKK